MQSWTLPEPLQHLRRLLAWRGNRGKQEFIQVLRLMEVFLDTIVTAAALDAIRIGAISFDAVKQLVIARVERKTANLDLTFYPICPPPMSRRPRLAIAPFCFPGGRLDDRVSISQSGTAASSACASSAPAQTADLLA